MSKTTSPACSTRSSKRPRRRSSSALGEPAAQEVTDVLGATVRNGVADMVRQPVIGPQLAIRQFAERLVMGDRADRLATRHDDERRAADLLYLAAPIVARHQQHELADIGPVVAAGFVEKPIDETGMGIFRQP